METPEDRNPGRKSIGVQGSSFRSASAGGSSGGNTRRYSIGTPSSQKSTEEEGNLLPNYLRASTGSCHDFCKYGRKHAHLKPKSPIIPKRPAIVDKEKLNKTVAPADIKKTTTMTKLKPSPDSKTGAPAEPIEIIKREIVLPSKKDEASKDNLSSSKKVTETNLKKLATKNSINVKQRPVTVNISSMRDDSAGSNGGRKKKDIKTVKKTGMIPQASGVKRVVANASTIGSLSPKPSVSRVVSLKAIKYKNPKVAHPLKDQKRMIKPELKRPTTVKDYDKTLQVVEAKNVCEAQPETIEMDYVSTSVEIIQTPISMDLINPPVSQRYESSSHKVMEEEPSITPISGSSQSNSNKEALEEELIYIDDDEVSEEEYEYIDNEEVVFVSESEDEMETSEGNHNKLPRKGRVVISEGKDDEAMRLKFRRGKVLDFQSENNGPRRLKFRRGRVIDNNEHIETSRRNFKKTFLDKEANNSNNGSESVVLKHQDVQGKKDAQGLFNNVIEETASKLVESRKSKVKALVGAFETVISLQDVRPSS